jgi:hypothetical protein
MRSILIAISVLAMTGSALADPVYRHRTPPRHHHQHNVMPWVAGAIGLGVLGALTYDQWGRPVRRRECWDEYVGYDYRGRPMYERVCNY